MSENVPAQPVPTAPQTPRNRAMLWILVVIGVLLLAVVVLLALLLLRPAAGTALSATGSPTPSVAVTPKPSPSPTPSPAATAQPEAPSDTQDQASDPEPTSVVGTDNVPKPLMQVFNLKTTVACVTGTDAVPAQLNFDITINWTARDTQAVYIGIDTDDAVANPFEGPLPAAGSIVVPFSCYGPHNYRFAAVGADGSIDQGAVTVVNTGDPDPYAK